MTLQKQHTQPFNYYLKNLNRSTQKRLYSDASKIIEDNNLVAQTLDSSDYQNLVKKIRQIIPDNFTGEISCVDGRIPSLFTHLPKITRTWKEPGSVSLSCNFPDQIPSRLAMAIDSHFKKYPKKHLIEFVQAHTSLNHQLNHGCGATKLRLHGTGPNFENDGGLAWNIRQLLDTTVIAISKHSDNNSQNLTVILEVLDTDTSSLYYGLDTYASSPLPKTEVAKLCGDEKIVSSIALYRKFIQKIQRHADQKSITVFTNDLFNVNKTYQTCEIVNNLTIKLWRDENIVSEINRLFFKIYPDKPKSIINSIIYRILHNISIGHLTGYFTNPDSNPFHAHHEKYISIGEVGIGDEVITRQGFRITHTGFKQIVNDLIIMLDLMQKTKEAESPFLVFYVKPVNKKLFTEDPYQQTLQRARTVALGIRRVIYNDPVLSRKLINQEFVLIPCLVEEKNQEVLEIPLFK